MTIKQPVNNDKYHWTRHVFAKMRQYQLSEQTIKRVIRNPKRIEEGVAPGTTAVMQSRGQKKQHEIWVMYCPAKLGNSKLKTLNPKNGALKIVTAWRYPGASPVRERAPIPQAILDELAVDNEF